jgi:hypothetical protein
VHASNGEKPTLLFTSNVFLSRKDQQTKKKKLLYIHTSYSLRCLYTSSTLLFPSSRRQENSRNNKNTVAKARTTSNVQRGSTTSRRRRLLLIIGRRRVVRLLRRRRQGRRCRVEVGGGVMAVVLASEGARVRSSCWRATRWTTTSSCRPASTPPARTRTPAARCPSSPGCCPSLLRLSHLNLKEIKIDRAR